MGSSWEVNGIDLSSSAERNEVARAQAAGNGGAGVLVDGSRNRIVGTVATRNEVCIDLDGARNVVRGGTLEDNAAYDVANCAGDVVKGVAFTTATPDCEPANRDR